MEAYPAFNWKGKVRVLVNMFTLRNITEQEIINVKRYQKRMDEMRSRAYTHCYPQVTHSPELEYFFGAMEVYLKDLLWDAKTVSMYPNTIIDKQLEEV